MPTLTGKPVAYINLLASGGGSHGSARKASSVAAGFFLDRVTGTTTITVWYE